MADFEVLAPGGHQHLVDKIEEQLVLKADAAMADAIDKVARNQVTREVDGEIISVDDAYAAPLLSLGVDGKSTQDGTPMPDAPVPIESVDGLAVYFCGKNMLNAPRNKDVTTYGMTWHFESDGSFHAVSGRASSTRMVVLAMLEEVHWPAGDYYLTFDVNKTSGGAETKGPGLSLIASDGTLRTIRENYSTIQASPIRFTLAEGERPNAINFAQTSGTSYSPNTIYKPRVWPATNADSGFAPYIGTTVQDLLPEDTELRSLPDGTKDTLALTYLRPSTREGWAVYGAELVQRVDEHTFNGSENWSGGASASYNGATGTNRFNTQIANLRKAPTVPMRDCLMSDVLMHTSTNIWSTPDNFIWYTLVNDNQVHIVFDNATIGVTAETGQADRTTAIKAWLAENPITIDYPLATPVTTTLDPIELPILPAPDVTVWSDPSTGLQMEYVRDTEIVIDSLYAEIDRAHAAIAPVEHGTSSANYAVGSYLMLDGTFCKVTSAIATGETIAIGTNVVATTVDAELASLA